MKYVVRIAAFCILAIASFLVPFPLFLLALFAYVFFWDGYELFLITIAVDSVFGVGSYPYMYTTALAVILFSAALLRPYLSWYTTDT